MTPHRHRPPATSIGAVGLGPSPRIAVPLTDTDLQANLVKARRWATIVELRVDMFACLEESHVASVCEATRTTGAAVLATVRCRQQGGVATLDDEQRLALYRAAAPHVDAIDVELRSPIYREALAIADRAGLTTIASHHDFTETPDDLELRSIAEEAHASGAGIVKIATTANCAADRNRLLDLLRGRGDHSMIAIAMGSHGAASRVFFPLCGSLITYGYLGEAVAPGQLSIQELHQELRRYCPDWSDE